MNSKKSKLLRKSAAQFSTKFNLSKEDSRKHYRQLKQSYARASKLDKNKFLDDLV